MDETKQLICDQELTRSIPSRRWWTNEL